MSCKMFTTQTLNFTFGSQVVLRSWHPTLIAHASPNVDCLYRTQLYHKVRQLRKDHVSLAPLFSFECANLISHITYNICLRCLAQVLTFNVTALYTYSLFPVGITAGCPLRCSILQLTKVTCVLFDFCQPSFYMQSGFFSWYWVNLCIFPSSEPKFRYTCNDDWLFKYYFDTFQVS